MRPLQHIVDKENISPPSVTPSDTKVFFAVQDTTDGRKFKVFLKPGDLGKLRVQKIRRTLSQTTGYLMDRITLYKGADRLDDAMTGLAFGLCEATLLTMRVDPVPSLETSPPPPPPVTPARRVDVLVTPRPASTATSPNHVTTDPLMNFVAAIKAASPPVPQREIVQEEQEDNGPHPLVTHVAELETVNSVLQKELAASKDEVLAMQNEIQMLRQSLSAIAQTRDTPELLMSLTNTVAAERVKVLSLERSNDILMRQLRTETARRKAAEIHAGDIEGGPVRVLVRLRPLLGREIANPMEGTVTKTTPSDSHGVVVTTPGTGSRHFTFFRTYAESSSCHELWEESIQPMVHRCIDSMSNLVMASYGQTGSGKTYTMDSLLARTIEDLFEQLFSSDSSEVQFSVSCSLLEVYNDIVRDIASGSKVEIRGLLGATRHQLISAQQAHEVVRAHTASRRQRSHLIVNFTVMVRSPHSTALLPPKSFQIAFLDLAGSERVCRGLMQRDRMVELQGVNKSLSALGDVFAALGQTKQQPSTHIPYRNCKLTQVLQDIVSNNHCKVVLLACVAPSAQGTNNFNETMATLTFASRLSSGK